MAFIGLRVPYEAAKLLEISPVPGERQRASDMHVTILYLGKGTPMVQVAKAMVVLDMLASSVRPFTISLKKITNFPRNPDDGWPVICPVASPELQRIHSSLKAALSKYGVPFSNKYPEYKPHVTMSYVREESPGFSFNSELPDVLPISVHELTLWGGEREGRQLIVTVPLTLSLEERVASRVAFPR